MYSPYHGPWSPSSWPLPTSLASFNMTPTFWAPWFQRPSQVSCCSWAFAQASPPAQRFSFCSSAPCTPPLAQVSPGYLFTSQFKCHFHRASFSPAQSHVLYSHGTLYFAFPSPTTIYNHTFSLVTIRLMSDSLISP